MLLRKLEGCEGIFHLFRFLPTEHRSTLHRTAGEFLLFRVVSGYDSILHHNLFFCLQEIYLSCLPAPYLSPCQSTSKISSLLINVSLPHRGHSALFGSSAYATVLGLVIISAPHVSQIHFIFTTLGIPSPHILTLVRFAQFCMQICQFCMQI